MSLKLAVTWQIIVVVILQCSLDNSAVKLPGCLYKEKEGVLDCSFRNLTKLPQGLTKYKKIDLSNNILSSLDEYELSGLWNELEWIDITGNPLQCDCHLAWFINVVQKSRNDVIKNSNQLRCFSPAILAGQRLVDTNLTDLRCSRNARFTQIKVDCFPKTHVYKVGETLDIKCIAPVSADDAHYIVFTHNGRELDRYDEPRVTYYPAGVEGDKVTQRMTITNLIEEDAGYYAAIALKEWFGDNIFGKYKTRVVVIGLVDECALGKHMCHENAICIDKEERYDCKCMPGYSGNGRTSCDDINECIGGNVVCDDNGACINLPGNYKCKCFEGFTGNGYECTDIDECGEHPDICPKSEEHFKCINMRGNHSCVCVKGYIMSPYETCIDVDECENDKDICPEHTSVCENTPGSFTCTCNKGWTDIGGVCIDVNECLEKVDECDENSNCQNIPGDYECNCKQGFIPSPNGCEEDKHFENIVIITAGWISAVLLVLNLAVLVFVRRNYKKASEWAFQPMVTFMDMVPPETMGYGFMEQQPSEEWGDTGDHYQSLKTDTEQYYDEGAGELVYLAEN